MQHVGAEPTRAEEVPAALVDWLFRGSANGQITPVAGGNLDVEAELAQEIGGDKGVRMRNRGIDRIQQDDLLAFVTGLGDQPLGLVEITLAGQRCRAGGTGHWRAAREEGRAQPPILRVAGIGDQEIRLVGNRQYRLAHLYIVEWRVEVVEAQSPHRAQRIEFSEGDL